MYQGYPLNDNDIKDLVEYTGKKNKARICDARALLQRRLHSEASAWLEQALGDG